MSKINKLIKIESDVYNSFYSIRRALKMKIGDYISNALKHANKRALNILYKMYDECNIEREIKELEENKQVIKDFKQYKNLDF